MENQLFNTGMHVDNCPICERQRIVFALTSQGVEAVCTHCERDKIANDLTRLKREGLIK